MVIIWKLHGTLRRMLAKTKRKQNFDWRIVEKNVFIFTSWSSKGHLQSFKNQLTVTQFGLS